MRKPTISLMLDRACSVVTVLLAVLAWVFVVLLLAASLRWGMRCDEGCFQRATEPGEPWTRYRDSWQWSAQFALAVLAVVAGLAAIMTLRLRPLAGVFAAMIAVTSAGGWIAWYLATPLNP